MRWQDVLGIEQPNQQIDPSPDDRTAEQQATRPAGGNVTPDTRRGGRPGAPVAVTADPLSNHDDYQGRGEGPANVQSAMDDRFPTSLLSAPDEAYVSPQYGSSSSSSEFLWWWSPPGQRGSSSSNAPGGVHWWKWPRIDTWLSSSSHQTTVLGHYWWKWPVG
jgi:hypothetical protein